MWPFSIPHIFNCGVHGGRGTNMPCLSAVWKDQVNLSIVDKPASLKSWRDWLVMIDASVNFLQSLTRIE